MPDSALQVSLTIGSHELTQSELNNIGELSYEESLSEMAQLEFSLKESESLDLTQFSLAIGEKVELKLGWAEGELVSVFEGKIQKPAPSFISEDPGKVTITAYDLGYGLRRIPPPAIFTDVTHKGLVEEICRKHELTPKIEPVANLKNYKAEQVTQKDETDFQILATIAEDGNLNLLVHGNSLFMVDDDYMATPEFHDAVRPGSSARKFRFVHSPTDEDLAAPNTWPLQSFEPELGSEGQRTQVEVKIWDAISTEGRRFGKGKLQPSKTGAGYTEVIVKTETIETYRITGKVAKTEAEARYLAINEMDRRAKELVKGEVVLVTGTPHLHVGMPVNIVTRGLEPFGSMFTGEYIIEAVRHEIDSVGAYSTTFDVRRDGVTQ